METMKQGMKINPFGPAKVPRDQLDWEKIRAKRALGASWAALARETGASQAMLYKYGEERGLGKVTAGNMMDGFHNRSMSMRIRLLTALEAQVTLFQRKRCNRFSDLLGPDGLQEVLGKYITSASKLLGWSDSSTQVNIQVNRLKPVSSPKSQVQSPESIDIQSSKTQDSGPKT